MYIIPCPAEKRRVLFFPFVTDVSGAHDGPEEPRPARDVAPSECWAFTDQVAPGCRRQPKVKARSPSRPTSTPTRLSYEPRLYLAHEAFH
jgi:hypothetical protein